MSPSPTTGFSYVPLEDNLSFSAACDFNRQHNAEHTCYVYAEPDGTVREITYLEFGRAVHRAAHILRPSRQGEDNATVAIIANSDTLLYNAVTVGLIKAGLVPFPISPRLSAAAVANLLRTSHCHRLVATQQTLPILMRETKVELGDEYDLTIEEMPALDLLYPYLAHEKATDAFEPYPEPEVPQKVEDMEIYLHSSGSTGFPKAIGHTHASIAGWSRLAMVRDGRRLKKRLRLATHMLPAFHTIGICVHLMTPMHSGSEVALYPPLVKTPTDVPPPPTPDSQLEGAQACGCTGLISVPAYIHQWAESPSAVEYLKTLQVLMYGGGPVSDGIGDNLSAAGVKLRSVYGATEFGAPTHIFPTHDEDWKEWCWSEFDREACLVWEDQGDGTE
ncbi:acetyl-CoA synthetase-like protein, partial [Schizophyllum commune Loenen D]